MYRKKRERQDEDESGGQKKKMFVNVKSKSYKV